MAAVSTLGIIGVGNLGGALAEGVLAAGAASCVFAADVSRERLDTLSARIGKEFMAVDLGTAVQASDLLVVAVKPQVVTDVTKQIRNAIRPGCPVVSVAAGVPLERIEANLRPECPVVRAMPNLAMLVRESATAICGNKFADSGILDVVETVFGSVGSVVRVDEAQMHAVTGLSGSGPAYVSLIVEGLAAGAVNKGLPPAVARDLACQLLYGSAKLLREDGWTPDSLRDRVTTPGGTTIAGLRKLEDSAVRAALMAAVEAASERSEDLASS